MKKMKKDDFVPFRQVYGKIGTLLSHAEALAEFGCEDGPFKAIGEHLEKLQAAYKAMVK